MTISTKYGTLALCLLCAISPARSQECVEFDEIPEDEYDSTYHDITSDARPLGFMKDTLIYQNSKKPCYTVNGVTQQRVEVKFETIPSMKLCVRDKLSDYQACAEGRYTDCMTLSSTSAELEFYCDVAGGCAEGDVNFWVRLTKGPLPEADTEGMWCHELTDLYPESLRPVPPMFTPAPAPGPDTSGAGRVLPWAGPVLTGVVMVYGLTVIGLIV